MDSTPPCMIGGDKPRTNRQVAMARKIIDLAGIAVLLGVSESTPPQWRQRSKDGELHPPLPEPDLDHIKDKPLWYEDTIIQWAADSERWPPGAAARPLARGPRKRRDEAQAA